MKVLFPIDEAYPLYKIGGLGDVGGSLPKALHAQGIDVRLALPKHPEISLTGFTSLDTLTVTYDREFLDVTVHLGSLPGTDIPVYLFQEDRYLSERTDAADNHADKFAVFALAVAAWLHHTSSFTPHLIHLHDWHTALIPVIAKHLFSDNYKSLITIHNLAFQGNTDTPVIDKLGIPPDACRIIGWDHRDLHLNILLEGILHVDAVNTVSPRYTKEILTQEYGQQLDHLLQAREANLFGILNGLDYEVFNPQTDPHLFTNFSTADVIKGKAENKLQLQRELGLPIAADHWLIGFVGRVDAQQKGVQLIIDALQRRLLPPENTQFVFLGTGDPQLESQLHAAAASLSSTHIATRYDEPLASRIYAASDMVLIPSRFEPCGLVQMIAMRYGTLPIARATGGLADTIADGQSGFLFTDYSTEAMLEALSRGLTAISQPQTREQLIHHALEADFSWDKSAQDYHQLYRSLVLDEPYPAT